MSNKQSQWVRHCLLIKQIHSLKQKITFQSNKNEDNQKNENTESVKCVFHLEGLDISRVQVVGVIVQVKQHPEKTRFEIDDGTGILLCYLWNKNSKGDSEREVAHEAKEVVRIGNLVTVIGKLFHKNHKMILSVYLMRNEEDPNAELYHYLKVKYFFSSTARFLSAASDQ